jgi:antitoxin MazE
MRVTIWQIGNSKRIIIPSALLAQVGLDTEADLTVEDGALVLRAPGKAVRSGWAEASAALAESGDDALLLPDFANLDDADWEQEADRREAELDAGTTTIIPADEAMARLRARPAK